MSRPLIPVSLFVVACRSGLTRLLRPYRTFPPSFGSRRMYHNFLDYPCKNRLDLGRSSVPRLNEGSPADRTSLALAVKLSTQIKSTWRSFYPSFARDANSPDIPSLTYRTRGIRFAVDPFIPCQKRSRELEPRYRSTSTRLRLASSSEPIGPSFHYPVMALTAPRSLGFWLKIWFRRGV
jgi:hypothetical protein